MNLSHRLLRIFLLAVILHSIPAAFCQQLELSRPAHTWEFFDAVGQRAAIFGHENGTFEAWVYPLKLVADCHLVFHFAGRSVPAEAYARTYITRPESSTIIYGNDSFEVKETFFVPTAQSGAVIKLEIDTYEPLEIEARFKRDFQLMWPASIGATYMNWDEALHAYTFGEESHQYFGAIGSPSAAPQGREVFDNNASNSVTSFRLGRTEKGHDQKIIVIAGSVKDRSELKQSYQLMTSQSEQLLKQAAEYYRAYLDRTVNLRLPDSDLQTAYDWSRISTVQGLVDNPLLGKGLIAGYKTSGNDWRPGYAWFFGRDSFWTDLALTAAGDFETPRIALEFISKFQRADGKIPHELAQSASLLPWFEKYPWGYSSADATPLYIIALDDYISKSGDLNFGRAKWESAVKAYNFLHSTYDEQGFPKNDGVGHGWVEGGPLLPVKTEFYQTGVGLQAVRSLAHLASVTGNKDLQQQLEKEFAEKLPRFNQAFWSATTNAYAFGIDRNNQPISTTSVLTTVPMWFGLADESKSDHTINALAAPDHAADWGVRILSDHDPRYDPTGYHFGSVWPLFTGWASVGEYKYHREHSAYSNLQANALLALNGPLGRVTEVVSGSFNTQLATSSPHQIWSSAMVISPLLRGMMGLESDQLSNRISFAPHVPASWKSFEISNVPACGSKLQFAYEKTTEYLRLRVTPKPGNTSSLAAGCTLIFSPALAPKAVVRSVQVNWKQTKFKVEPSANDQHALISVPLHSGSEEIQINLKNDFGYHFVSKLPELGATSEGIRVLSESWSDDGHSVQIKLAAVPGKRQEILFSDCMRGCYVQPWGANQNTMQFTQDSKSGGTLSFSGNGTGYVNASIRISFNVDLQAMVENKKQ